MRHRVELDELLSTLGIPLDQPEVVVLFPLAAVAWADGQIQPAERQRILEIAHRQNFNKITLTIIDTWLKQRPSASALKTATQAIGILARRHRGPRLNQQDIAQLKSDARSVAHAAGGWFDLLFTLEPREVQVLSQLDSELGEQLNISADLPTPKTGRFDEL